MSQSLTQIVNSKIKKAMSGIDKSDQLQSVIDPELLFRRNSINLYTGKRGSGKTFNVLRELIKLLQLPDKGGYNSFIYCTDKSNDSTVNELLSLIKLKVRVVSYADMPVFLADLIDAKNAYQDAIEKGVLYELTESSMKDLMVSLDLNQLVGTTPHTVVLYDDAINIFKSKKFEVLLNLLFQNRQPRITYFLCIQEGFAIPPQVKRNTDTCIVFGGYNDNQMLTTLFSQLNSSDQSNKRIIEFYKGLSNREGIIFDYLPNETSVKVLRE
jgi:Cdc6-like AAA superfamily ATPase